MTVVVGMTDLLLMTAEGEPVRLLQSVKQAADVMLRMLDEAVDFSRLETGSFQLDQGAFLLTGVTHHATDSLASGPAPLRMNVAIDPAVPIRLVGDGERFSQILEALTRTAAKLRPAREYDLHISAERPAGDVMLRCALSEQGTYSGLERPDPISANEGEFLRLIDFDRRGYLGSGLGLPVAAGLAELMGGSLWMSAHPKSPLIFQLTARFELPSEGAGIELLAALEQRLASEATPDRLKVLLAEDTAANRDFFRVALEQRGHHVVAVANGQEALQAFESADASQRFDLVLLDIEMPVLGGREAAAAFSKLESFAARRVPLVALTAHQIEGDSAFSSGGLFDAAISKPCDLSHLYAVIECLAEGRKPSSTCREGETTSCPRIDYRGTLRRLGGNEQLFHELRRFFLEDVPVVLADLCAALDRRDLQGVERGAHNLKGLVANFGASDAMSLAGELQKLAHQRHLEPAAAILQQLLTEVDFVQRELQAVPAPCNAASK